MKERERSRRSGTEPRGAADPKSAESGAGFSARRQRSAWPCWVVFCALSTFALRPGWAGPGDASEAAREIRRSLAGPSAEGSFRWDATVWYGLRPIGKWEFAAAVAPGVGPSAEWALAEKRQVLFKGLVWDVSCRARFGRELQLLDLTLIDREFGPGPRTTQVVRGEKGFIVKDSWPGGATEALTSGADDATAMMTALLMFLKVLPETVRDYRLEVWSEMEGRFLPTRVRVKGIQPLDLGTTTRQAFTVTVEDASSPPMTLYFAAKSREFLLWIEKGSGFRVAKAGVMPSVDLRPSESERFEGLNACVALVEAAAKEATSDVSGLLDLAGLQESAARSGESPQEAERRAIGRLREIWGGRVDVNVGTLDDLVLSQFENAQVESIGLDLCRVRFQDNALKGLEITLRKAQGGWRVLDWTRAGR